MLADESVRFLDPAGMIDELGGQGLDRSREIDQSAGDGAVRHAGETLAQFGDGLGDGQAAILLDRLDAEDAVGAASRQHDADGVFAAVLRQRAEENVDRRPLMSMGRYLLEPQASVGDGQGFAGRQHIDPVRRHLPAVHGRFHGQRRMTGQNFGEEAFVAGGEMRDDDEGHVGLGRHGAKELFQGVKSSGGSADADDGKPRIHIGHRPFTGDFTF